MFKQDWFERQVEAIGNSLAAVLFGKEKVLSIFEEYEEDDILTETERELLKKRLDKLLSEKKINEAENLLFSAIKKDPSPQNLEIALNFYDRVNNFNDKTLKEADFSRDEIKEGIEQLKKLFEK